MKDNGFKIYAFLYGEIREKTAIRETDKMYILESTGWHGKNQRIAKVTYDEVWRLSRTEAVQDGIKILNAQVNKLHNDYERAKSQLARLNKELP